MAFKLIKSFEMIGDQVLKAIKSEDEHHVSHAKRINPGGKPLSVNDFVSFVLADKISGTSRLLRHCVVDRL